MMGSSDRTTGGTPDVVAKAMQVPPAETLDNATVPVAPVKKDGGFIHPMKRGGPGVTLEYDVACAGDALKLREQPKPVTPAATPSTGPRALEVHMAEVSVHEGLVDARKIDRRLRVPPGFMVRELGEVAEPGDLVQNLKHYYSDDPHWELITKNQKFREGQIVLARQWDATRNCGMVWHIDRERGSDESGVGSYFWPFATEEGALDYLRDWYRDTTGRMEEMNPHSITEVHIDDKGLANTRQIIKSTDPIKRDPVVPAPAPPLRGYGKLTPGTLIQKEDMVQVDEAPAIPVPTYLIGNPVGSGGAVTVYRKYTSQMKLDEVRHALAMLRVHPGMCVTGVGPDMQDLQTRVDRLIQLFTRLFPKKGS